MSQNRNRSARCATWLERIFKEIHETIARPLRSLLSAAYVLCQGSK
jgi:hypothetical protein